MEKWGAGQYDENGNGLNKEQDSTCAQTATNGGGDFENERYKTRTQNASDTETRGQKNDRKRLDTEEGTRRGQRNNVQTNACITRVRKRILLYRIPGARNPHFRTNFHTHASTFSRVQK